MKCNKCGAEIEEGKKFCGECGAPAPQEKKCAKCGATIDAGVKFCPECGANQSNEEKRCHVCGSFVTSTKGIYCPECGEFTCEKCCAADKKRCNECARKSNDAAENRYREALNEALADGRIDLDERRILNELAKKLGLSNEQVAKLEREVKDKGNGKDAEGTFSTVENLELESARKKFYSCEGDLSTLLSAVQKIYSSHPVNEKVLSIYLPLLAANGKRDEALKLIQELGADVLSAYITSIDIYLSTDNMVEAERALEKAVILWSEDIVLKCYQVYYFLVMYHKYDEFSFLEKATNINASLKDVKGELALSHQLRVMSLLQKESGEEPPVYDADFCKQNGLYLRIVGNSNLGGVYIKNGCSYSSGSSVSSGGTGSGGVKFDVPDDYYAEECGDLTYHNNFVTIRNLDNSPNPELTRAIADFCRRNWPNFEENFTVEPEEGLIYSRWNNTANGPEFDTDEDGFCPFTWLIGDYGVYHDANVGFEAYENFEENWDYIISSFSYDPDDGFDPKTMDDLDRKVKYKIHVTAMSRNGYEFIIDRLYPGSVWDIWDPDWEFRYWSSFYEDVNDDDHSLYHYYELDRMPDYPARISGYVDGDHIRSPENGNEYACVPPGGWNNCDNDTDHNIYLTTKDLIIVNVADDCDFIFKPEDEIEDD
ncbi:MAG: zinc ribbon domain-containing protein [Treponema sp.]